MSLLNANSRPCHVTNSTYDTPCPYSVTTYKNTHSLTHYTLVPLNVTSLSRHLTSPTQQHIHTMSLTRNHAQHVPLTIFILSSPPIMATPHLTSCYFIHVPHRFMLISCHYLESSTSLLKHTHTPHRNVTSPLQNIHLHSFLPTVSQTTTTSYYPTLQYTKWASFFSLSNKRDHTPKYCTALHQSVACWLTHILQHN